MLTMMTDAARKVLDEAMKLPDDARRELAWKLLDGTAGLDDGAEPFDDEQLAELARRVREILTGQEEGEDQETVDAHVEEALRSLGA